MSGPEILAAQVRTPILKHEDGTQMSMAERLDLAHTISLGYEDDYERARWNMLSSGEQEMLAIAADFRTLCTGVTHARIDEGLRSEIGRAFVEYGAQLMSSQWHPVDSAEDAAVGRELLADRRAELAGDL